MSKNNTSLGDWNKKGWAEVDGKLVRTDTLVAKKVDKIEPGLLPLGHKEEVEPPHIAIKSFIETQFAAIPKETTEQIMRRLKQQGIAYIRTEVVDPNTKVIHLSVDYRDMDVVAKDYLTLQGKKVTQDAVKDTVKLIRRQECEDCLMRLNYATEFFIPGEVISSKNHMRIMTKKDGKQFIMKGKNATANDAATVWSYKTAAEEFRRATAHLPFPLFIKFTFIMSKDAHFDFNNLAQGPLDQMQKCGWIRNDSRKHLVPVFNPIVYVHPEKVGLIISVL